MEPKDAAKSQEHVVEYTVDTEQQTTVEKVLTPIQIMANAGIDPATHYLVLKRGESENDKSYENEPNAEIHMHPHMEFFSNKTGDTPVS